MKFYYFSRFNSIHLLTYECSGNRMSRRLQSAVCCFLAVSSTKTRPIGRYSTGPQNLLIYQLELVFKVCDNLSFGFRAIGLKSAEHMPAVALRTERLQEHRQIKIFTAIHVHIRCAVLFLKKEEHNIGFGTCKHQIIDERCQINFFPLNI